MTSPHDQNPDDRNPADHAPEDPAVHDQPPGADPAGEAPTAPLESTQPDPGQAAPAPQPTPVAAAPRPGPTVVPVQKRWLVAGSAVGALAVVGLAFGAGFLVGDNTGDDGHGDRGRMSAEYGQMPGFGSGSGGGRRLFVIPDLPGQEQGQGQQDRSGQDGSGQDGTGQDGSGQQQTPAPSSSIPG
ncbi:hypothetical protein [Gordonia humi]|uniref:Uncharacterized protein n=1 Tax=Gordonia humi TaxID=686429 RepID=A0A840F678_9ACTN|nr:hypothetical protein [Gordonia humi]MBB4137918.1 hypothetical protein [Gordonia humi]